MNERWGNLANKMGTLVEDIDAPSVRRQAREVFDCGELQHLGTRASLTLVEIAGASAPTIKTCLGRTRRVYEESTGTTPTRVILATASIHSRRAQELQRIGIEVIEPDDAEGPAGAQQP